MRPISERTKDVLAAAKRAGKRLDRDRGLKRSAKARAIAAAVITERAATRAADIASIIAEIKARGATSLRAIAAALNARGIPAARGGQWSSTQVRRVLGRL
jgi:hypothetical protein